MLDSKNQEKKVNLNPLCVPQNLAWNIIGLSKLEQGETLGKKIHELNIDVIIRPHLSTEAAGSHMTRCQENEIRL